MPINVVLKKVVVSSLASEPGEETNTKGSHGLILLAPKHVLSLLGDPPGRVSSVPDFDAVLFFREMRRAR